MAQRQYKREPLDDAQIDQLVNACETFREKLIVWTLLDTGLRVSDKPMSSRYHLGPGSPTETTTYRDCD